MPYQTDLATANSILGALLPQNGHPLLQVCNPVASQLKRTDQADGYKGVLERQGLRAWHAQFYVQLGATLAAAYKGWFRKDNGLDCVGMTALLFHLVTHGATPFSGHIHLGRIGSSATAGHVYLLLHHGCCNNGAMIFDLWSHIHPERGTPSPGALIPLAQFATLLPNTTCVSMLTSSGTATNNPLQLHVGAGPC